MDETLKEQFTEIANILQYIVEYPEEADPVTRSNAFKAIQTQTKRALIRLENHPLSVATH